VALAPLGFVMVMSFGVNRLSTAAMQGLFWAFSVVMGMSLSAIFFVYTGPSIAVTFFATAGASPVSACSAIPRRRAFRAWAAS
jgi:FtsH-binding integral membrane protein